MAYSFDTNNSPATGAEAMFSLKEVMKTAGWTVISSSDGTTYNAAGDEISSGSSGAGGMANSLAWFRIRMPTTDSVTREFVFQRSTSLNYQWRIKYSFSATFSGGSPDATTTPDATDEQFPAGGGTSGSPSFTTIMTTDGTTTSSVAAGGSAEGYTFYLLNFPAGGGTPNCFCYLDRMVAGTFPSADVDPYVMKFGNQAPTIANIQITNITEAFLAKGLGGESWTNVAGCIPEDNSTYLAGALGTNPHTGNDDSISISWARRSALGGTAGWKGVSSMLKMNGVSRTTGDTLTVSTTRDRFIASDVNIPWDGSVPSL